MGRSPSRQTIWCILRVKFMSMGIILPGALATIALWNSAPMNYESNHSATCNGSCAICKVNFDGGDRPTNVSFQWGYQSPCLTQCSLGTKKCGCPSQTASHCVQGGTRVRQTDRQTTLCNTCCNSWCLQRRRLMTITELLFSRYSTTGIRNTHTLHRQR